MEKTSFYGFRNSIRYLCIASLILTSVPILAVDRCDCYFCGEEESKINYEELGEYEDMFRNFEEIADTEDEDDELQRKGFLKKWCKKLKRWFKKNVANLVKKMIGFKTFKSGEHCAYEIAHFKRKIDSKLHKTVDIENMLGEFDNHSAVSVDANEGMNRFKNRIRYYYHNPKSSPPKHPDHNRYDQCVQFNAKGLNDKKDGLEDIPVRALIGGVEIACGFLIQILPFPGCMYLGRALIGHGATQIYDGYMNRHEEDHPNKPNQEKGLQYAG